MSAVAVQFQLDDSELLKALDAYASRTKNLKPVFRLIALDFLDRVEDNFASESGFAFGEWEDLAPATIAARRKNGVGYKILQDTGVMAGSVTPDYGNDFAEAFTTIFYAKYHTSKEPRSKLPLRDFFDIDIESAQKDAAELILEEII